MTIFAKLYIDEDLDVLVATLLIARGWEATTAREQERLSQSDASQLAYAVSIEHCLLTHNRLDFEKLHLQYLANNQQHFGIIIASRRNAYELTEKVAILLDTLTADEIATQ